jgi:predicted TIM-barrel fold metal-dependent hydrolase
MRNGLEVVDADGHVQEPADLWDKYMDERYYEYRPRIDPAATDNGLTVLGHAMIRPFIPEPGSDFRRVLVAQWNERFEKQFSHGFTSESYIEAMDAEGIDVMVLYPGRGLYAASMGEMDGGLSSAICRAYNRWLAEFCARDSRRLVGVGLVALHDPALATAEARYAIATLGHRGIMIRPNPVFGRNLDDPAYDGFYAEVASLGAPLGVHEGSGVWMPEYGVDRWPSSNLINHTLCHPMEQMAAVCSMTAGGVMERHPQLRVGFLEAGGGWLPYLLERLDEHAEMYGAIPSETGHLTMAPSEYFRRQGWISCEPDERALRLVADTVGADRMLWASDYPHPDAEFPGAVDKLMRAKGLDDEELRLFSGASAKVFYGLD